MKKKYLYCLVIILIVTILGITVGCNRGEARILRLNLGAEATNLMEGATIVAQSSSGAKLSDIEVADRANMLKNDDRFWLASANGKTNESIFKLKNVSTFNTAIISEIGDNVMHFRLEAYIDGNWKLFYSSEKMQDSRIISFDSVTTDRIRLTIDKFKHKECMIKNIQLYNMEKANNNFNTTVYQRLDCDIPTEILAKSEEEIRTFARYYDVYNTIIIFDVVKWNEQGKMSFVGGEENFAKQIDALKEILTYRTNQHKVNIIVTALADGAGGGHIGVNKLMHANHTRIATEMVAKFIKPISEGGYDLDGLDIDWEYPQNKKDWKCYDTFMQELDEKMTAVKPDSIISSALSAGALNMSRDTLKRIDQIQYMAYDDMDIDGYQSTIYYALRGLQKFVDNGANLNQINLGIPSYGRPVVGGPYWPTWRNLTNANYFDSVYDGVECDTNYYATSSYCSPALASDKTALALLSGCGGIMVFRLACDKLMDDPNAVACGIENTLRRYIPEWWKG